MPKFDEAVSRWYAVYTRGRHEKKVYEKIVPKAAEVFLPLIEVWSKRKDRRKKIQKPLIPGYLFFREKLDPEKYIYILQTDGVVKILTSKEGKETLPAPIPDEQIDSLKILLQSKAEILPYPYLKVGESVEVIRGPFMGAIGKLIRIKPNKHRLVVSIDLISQSVAVEIDAADVEKVD